MEPTSFIAGSAEEAVALIREKLGPEAIVLNVRQLPVAGLARIWQKPMIEVLACLPQVPVLEPTPLIETLADFRQQLAEIKEQVCFRPPAPQELEPVEGEDEWPMGELLRRTGLLRVPVQQVQDKLRVTYGDRPALTLAEEMRRTREILTDFWRQPETLEPGVKHIFIGPAGSGKTTYLCKWLTQAVLVEGRSASVWRLDSTTANTAESLSVYGDILGVPVKRTWETSANPLINDIAFIDLPGVEWRKPKSIQALGNLLRQFAPARIHLVLNAAYAMEILLEQIRAFAGIAVDELSVTHLDEEPAWGKMWNLVLGTNFSIRHFSAGQNIPGDFFPASPDAIFARQFPLSQSGSRVAKQASVLNAL